MWMLRRTCGVQCLYPSESQLSRGFTQPSLCASVSWLDPKGWTVKRTLSIRKNIFQTSPCSRATWYLSSRVNFFLFYFTSVSFYYFFFCLERVPSWQLVEQLSSVAAHGPCCVCLAKKHRASAFACYGMTTKLILSSLSTKNGNT